MNDSIGVACDQALLFRQAKRARSRETRFTRPNRRVCSQATNGDSTVLAENFTSFCFEAAGRLNFRTVKVVLGRDT